MSCCCSSPQLKKAVSVVGCSQRTQQSSTPKNENPTLNWALPSAGNSAAAVVAAAAAASGELSSSTSGEEAEEGRRRRGKETALTLEEEKNRGKLHFSQTIRTQQAPNLNHRRTDRNLLLRVSKIYPVILSKIRLRRTKPSEHFLCVLKFSC